MSLKGTYSPSAVTSEIVDVDEWELDEAMSPPMKKDSLSEKIRPVFGKLSRSAFISHGTIEGIEEGLDLQGTVTSGASDFGEIWTRVVEILGFKSKVTSAERSITTRSEIEDRFSKAFEARGEERGRLARSLTVDADPDVLLKVGISEFRQKGNEDRLGFVASILGDRGVDSYQALQWLASSEIPEAAYFAGTIAYLKGVDLKVRAELLRGLARNPEPDVRRAVLDSLHGLRRAKSELFGLLRILSSDSDVEISADARYQLGLLAGSVR